MTNEEILNEYDEMLYEIDLHGIDEFKKFVEKNKDTMPMATLTIASSIIAMFDLLEKKEKN